MVVECSEDYRFCVFVFFLRTAVEGEGEHHVLSGRIDLAKADVPEIAQKHIHTLLIRHRRRKRRTREQQEHI